MLSSKGAGIPPLHLWRGAGGEEFIHRFIEPLNILLIINPCAWPCKTRVNVFYFPVFPNENGRGESKYLAESRQCFRSFLFVACSGNNNIIVDTQFFFHLLNTATGILEIIFLLV